MVYFENIDFKSEMLIETSINNFLYPINHLYSRKNKVTSLFFYLKLLIGSV